MRELEIYIHIPFCVKKCAYCDFLSAPADEQQRDHYVQTLLEEIRGGAPVSADALKNPDKDYIVTSVFFGGGTPSLLPAEQIVMILDALRSRFHFSEDAEITIECNPGALEADTLCNKTVAAQTRNCNEKQKMKAYRACGINRISFGVQSADNRELAALGRIHTWETFLHSYEMAREAGFTNINVDLMSALPGQTAQSWERTLRKILALAPEHISAYSLIIEEGTPFYQKYHEDDVRRAEGEDPRYLPSEEEERAMYVLTEKLLGEAGYEHYEISNYARPGYACRHNIGYWRGTEYLGFGLGASSLLRHFRSKNPSEYAEYERQVQARVVTGFSLQNLWIREPIDGETIQNICEDVEVLSAEDEMSEFMFLGLRMLSGISEADFAERFHRSVDEVYGKTIGRLIALELLQRQAGRIFLTPRGLDLSNQVMAEFLL